MFNIEHYTLETPREGGEIAVLPRYGDEVWPSGLILSVRAEGFVDGLETYQVKTREGETLRVVVLKPQAQMDEEADRCFWLLRRHRSDLQAGTTRPDAEPELEPEPERRSPMALFLAALMDQVRRRPLFAVGLIVIVAGIVLILLGYDKLGQMFIDLGTKVILTIGSLMSLFSTSIPVILNNAADWVQPVYFMTWFVS
ncbi:MAG TPA: hypothetical protein VMN57_10150 [Anaerolineales bacterium]|nr:hypothetical protein [Anaerolineales bacterium]